MGERGHTVHVLGEVRGRLAELGARVAVLGSNERWTTFVPMGTTAFDDGQASEVLGAPLVHVWFEEDVSLVAGIFAEGLRVGELTLSGEDVEVDAANLSSVDRLVALGIVPAHHRTVLLERLRDPVGLGGWTMAHGLEELLELPYFHPVPIELPEAELLVQLEAAGILVDVVEPVNHPA